MISRILSIILSYTDDEEEKESGGVDCCCNSSGRCALPILALKIKRRTAIAIANPITFTSCTDKFGDDLIIKPEKWSLKNKLR